MGFIAAGIGIIALILAMGLIDAWAIMVFWGGIFAPAFSVQTLSFRQAVALNVMLYLAASPIALMVRFGGSRGDK